MFSVDDYSYPALVLNNELKIVSKNAAASVRRSPYRVGSRISHYLSRTDTAAVKELKRGDYVIVTLLGSSVVPAIVFSDGDSYLVRTRVITLTLQKRLSSVSSLQKRQVSALRMMTAPDANVSDMAIRHSLYLQECLCDYMGYVVGTHSSQNEEFDAGEILESICVAAKEILKRVGADILCLKQQCGVYVFGCKRDFEQSMISCIALCYMLSSGKRAEVRLRLDRGRAVITFFFDDAIDKEQILHLEKCINVSDFSSADGEAAFMLMLTREMCRIMGGDLVMSVMPSETKGLITVTLPCRTYEDLAVFMEEAKPEKYAALAEDALSVLFDEQAAH